MPVTEPRCKLINFRLSPEEHATVTRAAAAAGARSLSEFARTAVLAHIGTDLAATVRDLQARVERLEKLAAATHIECGPLASVAFGLVPSSSGEVKS